MRGDGRVFERKGISPCWWIAYYHHGKEHREVAHHVRTGRKLEATTENRHEAERYLKRKLGQIAAEQHGGPAFICPQQQRVTIGELLDALERDYRLREKWGPKVASNVKPLRDYFGAWRAVDVTSDATGTYIEKLREQGYSNATVNRRTQLLGQAFKVAVRNKQVAIAPFIPHLSEIGNERQGFFEAAHLEAVVRHLPDYLQDFTRFGFLTGWRKGSIASLRWADVGQDVIYLPAENSKIRKPETMPLEGELRDIIQRRRAAGVFPDKGGGAQLAEYVFHRNGEPIGDFRKAWARACCASGVGKVVCPNCKGDVDSECYCAKCNRRWKHEQLKYVGRIFHDLRRTAARNLIRADVQQVVAMQITGHRTDSMFRRYAIVDEKQKREALAKTQRYLATTANRKVLVMAK